MDYGELLDDYVPERDNIYSYFVIESTVLYHFIVALILFVCIRLTF